jgi:hypothetical protein
MGMVLRKGLLEYGRQIGNRYPAKRVTMHPRTYGTGFFL